MAVFVIDEIQSRSTGLGASLLVADSPKTDS
jgi:hypothetical protein